MKVYFVNSAFVTIPKALVLNNAGIEKLRLHVRYGIIVHPELGPIIVDGGYGPCLYNAPAASFALKVYRAILRPKILPSGAPVVALAQLGFGLADVKHIVLTHCHADHVGYLEQFPDAKIHTSARVVSEQSLSERGIFREILPSDLLKRAEFFDNNPEIRLPHGLGEGRDIFGDQSVLAIDLTGHTDGHFGLYFPKLTEPFLYAVDIAWSIEGVVDARERLSIVKLVSASFEDCQKSAKRVRNFYKSGGKIVLCHDPEPTDYDLQSRI